MLWWLIPVLLIASLLIYLLLAPLFVEVDSDVGLCRVRFHHVASAALKLQESSLIVDIRVVGWKKGIDLLAPKETTQKHETKEPVVKAKKRKSGWSKRKVPFRKIVAVLRSFRINKCKIVTDTGDMPMNGILFPVFYGLSYWTGRTFRISFLDENVFKLEIENNIARMLWAYIRA